MGVVFGAILGILSHRLSRVSGFPMRKIVRAVADGFLFAGALGIAIGVFLGLYVSRSHSRNVQHVSILGTIIVGVVAAGLGAIVGSLLPVPSGVQMRTAISVGTFIGAAIGSVGGWLLTTTLLHRSGLDLLDHQPDDDQ